jgi:hypothetical protein
VNQLKKLFKIKDRKKDMPASKVVIAKMKERQNLFLTILENKAGNITKACKAINIDRGTFYYWMAEDIEFHGRYLEVREALIDFAESTLLTLIKDKQPAATIFFLKTQAKHRGYTE